MIIFESDHVPLSTDVGSRPQDDQQAEVLTQLEEIFQISISTEVVHTRHGLVEVPGYVPARRDAPFHTEFTTLHGRNSDINMD